MARHEWLTPVYAGQMDDTQRIFKVTIGGVEYAAAPFDEGQLTATQLIKAVPDAVKLRVISGLFRGSLGDDAHTDLVLRLSYAELSMADWLEALRDIAKLTGEANAELKKNADDASLPADGSA